MNNKIINGNNIELLKEFPDNHFDSIVTDPPYGLGKEPNAEELMNDWIEKGYHEISGSGFMGKEWDAFVPQPIFWKEIFRVLKPGGHVLAFYGTRTYDWGVMAMRFAGFEVRDCIQWLYGSGFPKSHNISKAIDKMGGESLDWFIDYILEVAEERGISKKELTMLFPSKNGNPTGWLWNKQNNQSITLEQYNKIKDYLQLPFDNIEEAEREVIGKGKAGLTKGDIAKFSGETEFNITTPKTDQAKQWDGWGSALKPANEPIVLARKPLEKGLSIAENVLKWGVGAINIDGCRVGSENRTYKGMSANKPDVGTFRDDNWQPKDIEVSVSGRFPANLILTHHPECECVGLKKVKGIGGGKNDIIVESKFGQVSNTPQKPFDYTDANGEETIEDWNCHEDCPIKILDEQSGILKSGKMTPNHIRTTNGSPNGIYGKFDVNHPLAETYGDKGGASRFFYIAKASKSERNKGLKAFEEKRPDIRSEKGMGTFEEKGVAKQSNFHPTVKPIKLMQYLVRLVTPPNGKVLDPFCGSGTTGVACKLEEFDFIGLEQDAEYCKIAQARIDNYVEEEEEELKIIEKIEGQLSLF
jgi:DNA modification methylase